MSVIRRVLMTAQKNILFSGRHFSHAAPKILNSDLPDLEIPKVTIEELVTENFGKWEKNVAVECAVTGRKYTYKEVLIKSKNLNRSFRKKLKLQKGDVVAVLLPNVPEFAIATLGILRAGLVATTVNPIYTPDEISRQLVDSSTKALITLNDLWNLAQQSVSLTRRNIPILSINTQHGQSTAEGAINFSEFTDNQIDFPEINDISSEDLAVLPYSSGTTGLPKGVKLSHANIVSNLCQLAQPEVIVNRMATDDHQDVTPAVLPMFHIYGFTCLCMLQLLMGAKIVALPKFTPELYLNTLRKFKPNVLYLAPPIAIFLANHPSVTKKDLAHVRTIVSGAAPLGALDEGKLIQKAERDIPVLQGYGLTETSPAVLLTRDSKEFKNVFGSLGKPISNTKVKIIAIDDVTGTPLGPNQTGELLVKGPQVMQGYHNNPEETKKAFMDGWLRTGDIMYYTDDGFFYITDRLKELIKVKGFQVAPAELEEVIRAFPNVAEAAVIGIPHPKDGEVPRAYVVPQQGTQIDPTELKEFVGSKVASYKQIRGGVAIVESIPKNATGKILRRQLKLQYENKKQII